MTRISLQWNREMMLAVNGRYWYLGFNVQLFSHPVGIGILLLIPPATEPVPLGGFTLAKVSVLIHTLNNQAWSTTFMLLSKLIHSLALAVIESDLPGGS